MPSLDRLPIDPSTDVPHGYSADQRDVPAGFTGEPDVMDTWATSSLTPQIAGHYDDDPDLFARVFPMDMRPQGHDIIRTWLFSTVVRSHFAHGTVPWHHAALSGWILDPDRKKMSKSMGNVVTPVDLFDLYGSDAVRYWAASARPGVDTAFSEDQMKVGRKLANKLLNATKFVSAAGEAPDVTDFAGVVTDPVDRAMLARIAATVSEATEAFEAFDSARALERTEATFWWFCDDYVELVKSRAYLSQGPERAASALAALGAALGVLHRLFAPFLPFTSAEVWSWWNTTSVHQAPWPTAAEFAGTIEGADMALLDTAGEVMSRIRRTKTEAQVSQRSAVELLVVRGPEAELNRVRAALADLRNAGSVAAERFEPGDELACEVTLAPVQAR